MSIVKYRESHYVTVLDMYGQICACISPSRISFTESRDYSQSTMVLNFMFAFCPIGVHPVTLNGSSSHAEFTFESNENVTLNATLRLRTRTQTTSLVEIYEGVDSFFKMELLDDRVQVHFYLHGETGTVYSGETLNNHHSLLPLNGIQEGYRPYP